MGSHPTAAASSLRPHIDILAFRSEDVVLLISLIFQGKLASRA